MRHTRLLFVASAATLIFACAKKNETPAAPDAAATEAAVEPEVEAVESMTEDARPAPIGSASVTAPGMFMMPGMPVESVQ